VTEPLRIDDRASANLRYIREAMERANTFTSIPGVGGIVIGVTAIAAAIVAEKSGVFLRTWIIEAALAAVIAFVFMRRKASKAGLSLTSRAARRFFVSYSAPIAAAALTTVAVVIADDGSYVLAPLWLLCYGASFIASGAFSIRVVPVMGVCFMLTGAAALLVQNPNVFMAAGFGGLHIIFGAMIARHHGG
jgi:hypothetical protein